MQTIAMRVSQEIFGLAGGAIFLLSWVLQAWESRQAGVPVVSLKFFVLRAAGCMLLIIEAIRIESISLFIVAAGTLVLNFYNIRLFLRANHKAGISEN